MIKESVCVLDFLFSVNAIAILKFTLLAAGILCGALLLFLSQRSNIQKDLSRISKGKRKKIKIHLSQKKIQKYLERVKDVFVSDGTLLGIDQYTGAPVVVKDRDANLHILAIGTTGSGKTTALSHFVKSAVDRRLPLFYVDGKGDLDFAKRIESYAKAKNVPFYLFSMVGDSVTYNPIAFGGFTSKKDRIIELRQWSEDHYRKIAEGYLQTVFYILEKANIATDLCTLSNYLEPETLYQIARDLKDQALMDRITKLENKRKDIESLIAEIQNIAHSEIGHLFDCKTKNATTLKQALDEKAIMYFCLQPLAYPAYAETLGKLIINDLKALIANQLKHNIKIPIFTIFDEFSVFAGDQVINLINQGRGAGVHAILATQSLSDIERKGGKSLLGQVLNNTNNYIIQRQNYPEDAEMLSSIIGTKDEFDVTSQVSGVGGVAVGSIRQTKQFIVHPDHIKRLKQGEAILVNKQGFGMWEVRVRNNMLLNVMDAALAAHVWRIQSISA